jgi:hypothetical protein
MNLADTIIARVAQSVAGIHDPRDRLARQVGELQGEIRALCSALYLQPDDGDAYAPDYSDEEPLRDERYADRAAAEWAAGRMGGPA